jgi:hypothetical protein
MQPTPDRVPEKVAQHQNCQRVSRPKQISARVQEKIGSCPTGKGARSMVLQIHLNLQILRNIT